MSTERVSWTIGFSTGAGVPAMLLLVLLLVSHRCRAVPPFWGLYAGAWVYWFLHCGPCYNFASSVKGLKETVEGWTAGAWATLLAGTGLFLMVLHRRAGARRGFEILTGERRGGEDDNTRTEAGSE